MTSHIPLTACIQLMIAIDHSLWHHLSYFFNFKFELKDIIKCQRVHSLHKIGVEGRYSLPMIYSHNFSIIHCKLITLQISIRKLKAHRERSVSPFWKTPDTAYICYKPNGSRVYTVPSSAGVFHLCAFQVYKLESEQCWHKMQWKYWNDNKQKLW